MRVPWKLIGVAGLTGVAATGVVVARRRRAHADYEPDELRGACTNASPPFSSTRPRRRSRSPWARPESRDAGSAGPAHRAAGRAGRLRPLGEPDGGTDRPAGAPGDRPAGLGATFPGAVLPFGMVQFSPDTSPGTENAAGGYGYDEHRLRGFSLTHFSGGGCATLQDVPILPTVARMRGSPVAPGSSDYAPRFIHSFSHAHEHAAPGSYGVVLDPGSRRRIVTGLTTTAHGAVGRFTFPSAHRASVLFNAGGSAKANGDAQVAVDPRHREITGSAESGRFCSEPNSYRVWFAARFDRRFAAYGTWRGPTLRPRTSRATDRSAAPAAIARFGPEQVSAARNGRGTAQAGAYASFDTRHSRAVEVRLGVLLRRAPPRPSATCAPRR